MASPIGLEEEDSDLMVAALVVVMPPARVVA